VVAVGTRSWGTGVAKPSVGQAYPDADALDAELVAQALHDRAGFAPLYHRYLGPVYGYCRRRLDPQDAEDATSHIFMQALGNIESCRGPSFRAWLFTIAHNVVVDRRFAALSIRHRRTLLESDRHRNDSRRRWRVHSSECSQFWSGQHLDREPRSVWTRDDGHSRQFAR
jgi:DNA-directed RNA polymerase specialized sigma24 family protein